MKLEDGKNCCFQPRGGYDIEVDDIVTGDIWSLGKEEFFNATKGYELSVIIEGHTQRAENMFYYRDYRK